MALTPPTTALYIDAVPIGIGPCTPTSPAGPPLASSLSSSVVEFVETAPLPGFSSLSLPLPAMEPQWQAPSMYSYYPDAGRPERQPSSSMDQSPTSSTQRRYTTSSQGQYLPPPPLPQSAPSSSMNLPPFSQTFHSGAYHSPPTGTGGMPPSSQPQHMQPQQHPSMAYSPQVAMPPPGYGGSSYYAVTSPIAMSSSQLPMTSAPTHRAPPPHSYADSPRVITSYHHHPGPPSARDITSPISPTTHFHPGPPPGGMPASAGSSSSSSYPSINKVPGPLPKAKRRTASDTQSNDSWDEDKYDAMDREDGDQPWGMPQEQYKALNPRDKKQVRNRIGARRFRAKRKEYVVTLEGTLRQREEEIAHLRAQNESQRGEINDLRHRLGMPGLPQAIPPPPSSGLGLSVGGGKEPWRDQVDKKVDQM